MKQIPDPLQNPIRTLADLIRVKEALDAAMWESRKAIIRRAREIGLDGDDLVIFLWDHLPKTRVLRPYSQGVPEIPASNQEFYEHAKLIFEPAPEGVACLMADKVVQQRDAVNASAPDDQIKD